MKYYILDVDVEPKVIGVRDGCAQAEIKRSGFTDKGLYDKTMKLMGSFESSISYVPDFDLELQYVKMKKSAKVTDIMLFLPILLNCKFLLSSKTKNIFEKYNLSPHNFFRAAVYTKDDQRLEYYLFFCKSLDYTVINFRNSIIYKGLKPHSAIREIHPGEILNITSLEEYRDANKSSITTIDKYVLNDRFDKTLDLFVLGANIFISEKLYQEVVKVDLSSVELIPAFGEHLWWKPTIEVPDI